MKEFSGYKEFTSMTEMSEYFGMDSMDIRQLIRKGKISCFLDGDMIVVDLDVMPDYLH
jgi:hypothetical protein